MNEAIVEISLSRIAQALEDAANVQREMLLLQKEHLEFAKQQADRINKSNRDLEAQMRRLS